MSFNSKDFKGFTFRSGPVKNKVKQNSTFWDTNSNDVDVDDFLGLDEYKAINLISLSSVLGIVFLFVSFFFQLNIFGFLSIFGVLVLSQVLHLSRLMTPDALSSLVFLCSVVLILRNLKVAGFFLLILALLVRPSNIVYTGLIPLFLLKDKKFIYFLLLYQFWCLDP